MKWMALIVLMFAGVGCGSQATVQKFDVPFSQAEKTLRTLYPPAFGSMPVDKLPTGAAKFEGAFVDIRRDEMTSGKQVVQVREWAHINKFDNPPLHRTTVVLKALSHGCEVEVQSPNSNKAVLLPSRDEAYEQNQMNQIAEALNKK